MFQGKVGNGASRLRSSLAVRFAALAGVALFIVMTASGYVGSRFEAAALREQVQRQGAQLTELAAAAVANDMITFALSDLDATISAYRRDASVRFLEIRDKDGKVIKTAGAADDGRLVLTARDIVAAGDPIGKITLGLSMEAIDRAIHRSWWLLVAREAVGLLVLWVVLYVLIRRTVGRPMSEMARVSGDVAEGDLTRRFAIGGGDEIGRSGTAFNSVLQRFHDIVARVRASAESVTVGAGQISAGNVDLSQRTEEQASSLQQTAATLEQFASTTRQNAEAAAKANEVAQSASQISSRGSAAVEKVVATMAEISANSRKIVDIITVIDGIAFQTNILALNAAVEAARAGDHGRGFAVVAAEVRALAQRSADAAKEIKALIASSVGKVDDGSKIAQEAGETISDLVAAVENVGDMVASIAVASREQSAGVQQINDTMGQMESIVQQNAAIVEQAVKAASELKSQADAPLAIVAGFQVHKLAGEQAVESLCRPVPLRAAPVPPPRLAPVAQPSVSVGGSWGRRREERR